MLQKYPEDIECIIDPTPQLGGIYISNLEAAQNPHTLAKFGIKAILSAARGHELSHPKTYLPHYLYVPADDHESFQISQFFEEAYRFIHMCRQQTNVLVHCLAGVSRSVTLVIAYLMRSQNWGLSRAYTLVKARRAKIFPNEGFLQQLKILEVSLYRMSNNQRPESPSRRPILNDPAQSISGSLRASRTKLHQSLISGDQSYTTFTDGRSVQTRMTSNSSFYNISSSRGGYNDSKQNYDAMLKSAISRHRSGSKNKPSNSQSFSMAGTMDSWRSTTHSQSGHWGTVNKEPGTIKMKKQSASYFVPEDRAMSNTLSKKTSEPLGSRWQNRDFLAS